MVAVIIKYYKDERDDTTVNFTVTRGPSDTLKVSDRIFLWEIETTRSQSSHIGGNGLAEADILVHNPNAGKEKQIILSRDAYRPTLAVNETVLRTMEKGSPLERELAAKITKYRGEGITPISDPEAEYLKSTFYPPAAIVDIGNIDPAEDETTRKRLVDARLGQGRFRREVLDKWGRHCAVSGCELEDILQASHIKPWKESSNQERLDPANGLLLTANLHALFDSYLISFEDDGRMLYSLEISPTERERLGIPQDLRRPDATLGQKEREFLRHHRKKYRARSRSTTRTDSN